jgi:hypothetical protein
VLAFIFYTSGAITGMHMAIGRVTDGGSCLSSDCQRQYIQSYHVC